MRIRAMGLMAAVLLSAAISTSAQAANPKGVEFTVYGAGTTSCGKWLADRQNLSHHVELNWVLGWLTSSSYFIEALRPLNPNGGGLRHTDANAVEAWLDKYCRENPLKNIADGSLNLVDELSKPE